MFQSPETSLERAVLTGYGHNVCGPYLVLDDVKTSPWQRRVVPVKHRTFTLFQTTGRFCTGRRDLTAGASTPCPLEKELAVGDLEQCGPCFAATGFNPAFYNAPHISPQQRKRNLQPHVVYLASFGRGALKVGMTHAARRLARLLEQGARLGAVLATFATADEARELEATIARDFEINESVRTAKKRQMLSLPWDARAASLELETVIARIAQHHDVVDARAAILDLDSHYTGGRTIEGSYLDLSATTPLAISGRCFGMIGDVLLVEQGGRRYMLSASLLLGHGAGLEENERGNQFVGQLGLPF